MLKMRESELDLMPLNSSSIGGPAIGLVVNEHDQMEEVTLLDGIYRTEERECTVENGIVVNYWGMPDENQLTFSEETQISFFFEETAQ